ncbi:MAG: T9SS type A sorting domain-containing protein [Crocinitomicaceae bacterium]
MLNRLLLFSVLLFSGIHSFAQLPTPLYAGHVRWSGEGNQLDEIDTTGGAFTVVGSVTLSSDFAAVQGLYGLATDPTDNQMYAVYQWSGSNDRRLGLLDPTSGSITDIGNSGNIVDIDFGPDGTLYGITGSPSGGDDFVSVDKVTGSTTVLTTIPSATWGNAIAYDPFADEMLYVSASSEFVRIDLGTLTLTDVGSTGMTSEINTMVITGPDRGYAMNWGTLYNFDPTTGTYSGATSSSIYHALGFGPLPCTALTIGVTAIDACEGAEVTLDAESPGGGTITWDMGVEDGVPFIPGPAGTYSYTATSDIPEECELNVSVEVFPLPTVIAGSGDENYCEGETLVLSAGGDADDYDWDPLDLDPGVGTHTYVLTGSYDIGCINTDTVEITVHPLPTVTASVDDDLICTGDEVILTGGGAETYEWDLGVVDGEPHVPVLIGDNVFTVTGTDENGCVNTAAVEVEVVDVITITGVTTDEIEGDDGTIDITISGGAPTYVVDWDDDEIGEFDDPADRTGLSGGTYTVVVVGAEGCEGTATFTVNSQLNLLEENLSVNVYPNPTTELFIIQMPGAFTFTITDLKGAVLLNDNGFDNSDVSLDAFAAGTYILTITKGDQQVQKQVVKL